MIVRHKFDMHAECPFVEHKQWDYYTVSIQTEDVIDVRYLERVIDTVRGIKASQEDIACLIAKHLSCEAIVELVGKHSQNSETSVCCRSQ